MNGCRENAGSARKRARLSQCECVVGSNFRQILAESAPAVESEEAPMQPALFFFDVRYFEGSPDVYQIPLAISTGAALDEITATRPDSIVARLTSAAGPVLLHDAVAREDFHQELLGLIAQNATLPVSREGKAAPRTDALFEPSRDGSLEKLAETPIASFTGAAQCSTRRSGNSASVRRASDSICRRSTIAASRISICGRFSARG